MAFRLGRVCNVTPSRSSPLVMNTREELLQAFEDDQAGQLGTIPGTPRPGHEVL